MMLFMMIFMKKKRSTKNGIHLVVALGEKDTLRTNLRGVRVHQKATTVTKKDSQGPEVLIIDTKALNI